MERVDDGKVKHKSDFFAPDPRTDVMIFKNISVFDSKQS
jgi:hypothetical protein